MPVGAGGGGARDVRAGGAFVEAYLKDNRLVRGLDGLRRRMSAFGSFMIGIGRSAAVAGGLIALPLLAAAKHFANTGDQLNKMSQRTGVSVEALSQLGYAAGQSGSSLEELGIGLKGMAKFTQAVAGGSAEAAGTLADLGIATNAFMAASPEERFNMLADGIASIKDETLRSAAAMKVFGKSGDALIPMLMDGTAGMNALRQEADGLGKTVTKEQAENATRLGDAWDRVKAAVMASVFAIGSALAPALEMLAGWLKDGAIAVQQFVKDNKALVLIVGGVAIGLLAAAAISITLGIAFKVLALGIGLVTFAFKALAVVIGFLASPIGLVVAGIAGLGALFLTQTEAGQAFTSRVGAAFVEMADTAKFAWGGIAAAIGKGDLEGAANIAFATMKLAWASTILFLTERWVGFKKMFRDGWADLGTGIRLMWNDLTSALAKGLAWVLDKALFLFRNTIGLIFDGLSWAAKKLGFDDVSQTLKDIGALRFDSPEVQAEIEAERIRERNDIVNNAAKAQAERDRFREQQINAAKADVQAARDELNRLVAEAHKPKVGPEKGGPEMLPAPREVAEVELQKAGAAAKGLFQSPNWKQSFGVGDKISERQLKVQQKMAKDLAAMNQKMKPGVIVIK